MNKLCIKQFSKKLLNFNGFILPRVHADQAHLDDLLQNKGEKDLVRKLGFLGILILANLNHLCAATANEVERIHQTKIFDAQNPASAITPAKNEEDAKIEKPRNAYPELILSKEILYKILASDISIQRGEWQSAYVTILGLAQQTRDPRLAKRAAEVAMGAQQLSEALVAIRLWKELAPHSSEASNYYLSLMVIKNDFSEIQQHFVSRLQQSTPAEFSALINQAQQLLARMKDKKRSFATLETLLKPYAPSLETHITLARAAFKNGDSERSLSEAKAALSLNPSSELAILAVAQASEKSLAIETLGEFIKQYPSAKEPRLAFASMLIEAKNISAAKAQFQEILHLLEIDKLPTAPTLYTLGAIELELTNFPQAETYFLAYLQAIGDEDNPNSAYISLAQIALQRKDTENADHWLSKVSNDQGKNATWFGIQMRRALILAGEKKYKEARQFLQEVKPSNEAEEIQILQTEAQVMRDAGQTLEAFVVLEAALSNFSGSAELLYEYAMLAESLKRFPEMESALKQLITVAPNNAFAYNALGYSYADRNILLDDALNLLKKANQLSPEDPYILDSLGWVKFRLQQFPEAEQILRKTFSMRPDPDIAVHLGEILWAQDKKTEAIQLFLEAKKKDSSNELLKSALQRLGVSLPN